MLCGVVLAINDRLIDRSMINRQTSFVVRIVPTKSTFVLKLQQAKSSSAASGSRESTRRVSR